MCRKLAICIFLLVAILVFAKTQLNVIYFMCNLLYQCATSVFKAQSSDLQITFISVTILLKLHFLGSWECACFIHEFLMFLFITILFWDFLIKLLVNTFVQDLT